MFQLLPTMNALTCAASSGIPSATARAWSCAAVQFGAATAPAHGLPFVVRPIIS